MVVDYDIQKLPFDPGFRISQSVHFKEFTYILGEYGSILGHINKTIFNLTEYNNLQASSLFSWLKQLPIRPENFFSKQVYIQGSDEFITDYWCVWLSGNCFLYSWDYQLLIGTSVTTPRLQVEYLSSLIKDNFLIKDFRDHLFLHYDTSLTEDAFALFQLNKVEVNLKNNYNNDLAEFNKELIKGIEGPKSRGFVLLSGPSGHGKTHYLRYLISNVNKRFMVLNPWHIDNYWSDFTEYVREREESVFIIEDMDDYIDNYEEDNNMFPVYLARILKGKKVDKLKSPHIFSINRTLTYKERKAVQENPQLIGHYEFNSLSRNKAELLADNLGKQLPDMQEFCLGDIYHGKNK